MEGCSGVLGVGYMGLSWVSELTFLARSRVAVCVGLEARMEGAPVLLVGSGRCCPNTGWRRLWRRPLQQDICSPHTVWSLLHCVVAHGSCGRPGRRPRWDRGEGQTAIRR